MTTLLHISASPRGTASESLTLADVFLDELREHRPDVTVEHWDLWDGTLPEFGPAAAAAKMSVFAGQQPGERNAEAWAAAVATFERFAAADHYLFSVPMWNHGIPYILKQLVDVISQPGLVFGFDPAVGYTGLLTGRTATAIFTSAVYGTGLPDRFGHDFQQTYLEDWLRWAGVSDIASVTFRRNLTGPDIDADRVSAKDQARTAALRL